MGKLHLGHILAFFAAALALSAAYISVIGWGKLFAGSATIVMIVMGIIEIAKVVTTIYLHKYSKKTRAGQDIDVSGKWYNQLIPRTRRFFKRMFSLNTYLTLGVIATMTLTSVGIYGFLTNAYQETANKMEIQDGEVSILEGKKFIFEEKIEGNNEIADSKTKRITQLSDLRTQQESRLDSLIANNHWTNVNRTRQDIEKANDEIQKLTGDIDELNMANSSLADSVSHYQVSILELKAGSDIAGEIGPLKYISTLTGRPMDSIINYLVLIIIFIFDPMAISLVLATNKVFELNKEEEETPGPPKMEPPVVAPSEPQEDAEQPQVNEHRDLVDSINGDFSFPYELELPEEKNQEVIEYVSDEDGNFEKSDAHEDANIKELVKGIDPNPLYLQLVDVLFQDGNRGVGDLIPPHKTLLQEIQGKGIQPDDKLVRNFLTICNLFGIVDMSDTDRVKILKDFKSSKDIISLVSKR
jgi:hypothetical protein